MKKPYIWLILSAVVVLTIVLAFVNIKSDRANVITTDVQQGIFEVTINTSGELEAKSSTPVLGPLGLGAARLWTVKIEDIIEEGTNVKKGDYVATLDRTEISERIRNEEMDVDESLNNLERTQIDTALELRSLRDELKKKQIVVEKKELELKNSQYEPPATIQQARLDVKEANMDYELAVEDYELRKGKCRTEMKKREIDLNDDQADLALLNRLNDQFIIRAPEDGMLIYQKERGQKIKKGSSISARDPVVAALPDLSKMISLCYVNEVDFRLVKIGQHVGVGIDAFPEKHLTGTVINIANVGEALASSDAKVFEVNVEILESDFDLKPGMTTSNEIVVKQIENTQFIPLECVHNQDDSINYVYLKKGLQIVKQQIIPGITNSNYIIVKRGLQPDDVVLLTIPENSDEIDFMAIN